MNVSRNVYYKWLKNKDILNNYELNRKNLGELIKAIHKRKPSYGYHRINGNWNTSRPFEKIVSDTTRI